MSPARAGTQLGAVISALLAAAVCAAPAAVADGVMEGDEGSAAPVVTGPVRKQVKTCRLYANETGFGMRCGKVSVDGATIRQILNGDPVPDCWEELLPSELRGDYEELRQAKLAAGEKGGFWLQTCLRGIDPKTLRVEGEVTFTEEVVWLPEGRQPVTLTSNQRALVALHAREVRIPMPTVATSPTVRPRVGREVAFRVVNDVQAGPVTYNRNGTLVQMRARLIHLRVTPEPDAAAINCAGAGVEVTAEDSRVSRPQACWWRYLRSSAAEEQRAYEVKAVTSWTVEYSTGGAWTRMATVEKDQITLQPVTEVQTVVVP